MVEKLNSILLNKNSIKINYEDLKNHLGYEDYFYDNVIKPAAKENNFDVSFSGKFIIFKKRGD